MIKLLLQIKENAWVLWRLVRAWIRGEYKGASWRLIAVLGLTFLYIVNPFDLISDVLPLIGIVDDVTLFGLGLSFIKNDLQQFTEWDQKRKKTADK